MKLLITIQILRNILKIFKKRKGKKILSKIISNNFILRLRFNNHINLSSKCYKYLYKKK